MASYEQYYNHLIKQAKTNAAAYNAQRRRQADEDAEEIREQYRATDRAAMEQSRLAVKQTEADYRQLYDANAVSEAVARRNAAEALANSQLTNSGLNATQQTAISLARTRTDGEVSLKKQAALDRIMQELDEARAAYRQQSAEKTAAVYEQAQEDMRAYEEEQTQAAHEQATEMQKADAQAAKQAEELPLSETDALPNTQSVTYKMRENTPSKTAVAINAALKRKQDGNLEAFSYLRKCVNVGWITAEERAAIMKKYDIREPQKLTYSYVSGMVDRMIQNGDKEDARLFVDTLMNTESINPNEIRDVIRRVM